MLDSFCQEDDMEHDPAADRNREPSEPDNNMNVDEDGAAQPEQDDNDEMGEDDAFTEEEFGPQEYSALNSQLDQLQSALDSLETRNDDIHSKLLDLLRSSREIRQVMVEENSQESGEGNPPPEEDRSEGSAAGTSNVAQRDKCSPTNETPVRKSSE